MADSKRVRIRVEVEYERDVPIDWTPDDVDFFCNDSSSCAINRLREVVAYYAGMSPDGGCPCNHAVFKCLGDAVRQPSTSEVR